MSIAPPDPTPAIEIRDLRIDYGSFVAVDDLSLTIPRGEVYGLAGPNGAGKTSTFRVLATLMEPTYGSVLLSGIDALEHPDDARRILGYMPDLAPVPSDLKIWEFLDFHAATHRLGTRQQRAVRVAECLEEVALTGQRNDWCRALSRGQTQRLVLAKTLLHRPSVLILDEPASGLDPLSRRELKVAVRKLAAGGATVFISSHILSELSEMCPSMCVMNRGRLLAAGPAEEVRRQLGRSERTIGVDVLGESGAAVEWLRAQPGVEEASAAGSRVQFGYAGDDDGQAALLEGLIAAGIRVKSFEERRSTFEDILVEVAESNRS